MQSNMSNTYCPLAWNHFSAYPSGDMRLCCNVQSNTFMKDNEGKKVQIGTVTNLLEYFNLEKYKEIRRNMINGVENSECKLCYDVERNKGKSMRQYFAEAYPFENFKDTTDNNTGEVSEVNINYLDLGWSNKCNLKCRMCSPYASDQLIKEYKDLDLFPGMEEIEIKFDWSKKWSYETIIPVLEKVIASNLDTVLVTGGEPLVNNEFFLFCNMLVESGYSKNIELSFHTNLTVMPQKWLDVFAKFKQVMFKVSIDGIGECYEYIRYPGKWSIIQSNIEELVDRITRGENFILEFHTVLSIFNYNGIIDLLDYLVTLPNNKNIRKLPHFNYVHSPFYASPTELPFDEKLKTFVSIEKWISENDNKHSNLLKEKVLTLKAVANIMVGSLPTQQDEAIRLIKKIDAYRRHDTKKYMPWIDK